MLKRKLALIWVGFLGVRFEVCGGRGEGGREITPPPSGVKLPPV